VGFHGLLLVVVAVIAVPVVRLVVALAVAVPGAELAVVLAVVVTASTFATPGTSSRSDLNSAGIGRNEGWHSTNAALELTPYS